MSLAPSTEIVEVLGDGDDDSDADGEGDISADMAPFGGDDDSHPGLSRCDSADSTFLAESESQKRLAGLATKLGTKYQNVLSTLLQIPLFKNLDDNELELVARDLKEESFENGHDIIRQGESGDKFFMIKRGAATIYKTDDEGHKEMVTRLKNGAYFGEMALIYDEPRTATIVAQGDVDCWYLEGADFHKTRSMRLRLVLQQVPLLSKLTPAERDEVGTKLCPRDFKDGDYIIREGDTKDFNFYLITKGSAEVTQDIDDKLFDEMMVKAPDRKDVRAFRQKGRRNNTKRERVLTKLVAGHCFGELALLKEDPRLANVRAVGKVSCLYLTKRDFKSCLYNSDFRELIENHGNAKLRMREQRERVEQDDMHSNAKINFRKVNILYWHIPTD